MSAVSRIPGLLRKLKGLFAAASQAEVDAGAVTGKFVSPSTLAGMTGNMSTPDFVSTEQTVAADTLLDVAHSLGAIPSLWQIVMRCTTAADGYAQNDEIVPHVSHSTGDQGVTFSVDATNMTVVQASQILLLDQGTFNVAAATTNYRWIMRAWK